ncbi:MAG: hypothetical protein K0S53_63 [Bacteroidetes bacterium]|jgi:signal transduction histidine kinase|nr:hypothetical protein [Bacteroidota bacterium]MDF2451732.1 hypothetical protein [Bacteroidota bacterium]
MLKKTFFILFLSFVCRFMMVAQYSAEVSRLLKDVKEASYYDSTKLFIVGKETIDKAIATNQKKAVAEVYLYYGSYFYYTQNIDRCKFYLKRAIITAKASGNKHIDLLANLRITFMDYELGINANAEQELFAFLNEARLTNDHENYAELLNLIGIIKESKNDLQGAAKLYLEGLAFSESHGITHYPSVFRNNLGLIKLYTGQDDDALVDFEKGLATSKKENDQNLVSHFQINICLIYLRKNRIPEALNIFKEVIHYARVNNHPRELASAFVNLGSAFNNIGKPEVALSYSDSAIVVLKEFDLESELTAAYLGKSDVLIGLKRYDEARKELANAKKIIEETKNLEAEANYNLSLYRIENAEKNYEKSLEYFLAYQNIKDSSQQASTAKIIQELQLKYNVQKKEIELEKEKSKYLLLEQKHQDERISKWIAIGVSVLILIIVVGLISYFYSSRLREKQASFSRQLIENIEADRLRISMDLHDDIGQSLSMIKTRMAVSKSEYADKSLESELSRVIEQTREISKNLYPSYLEKIGLVRSIARLVENIQNSTKLECSFDVTDKVEHLPISVKTHLYRILQECTNNTIKYAQASALKISISEKNKEFILVYQDNGIGLSSKQKNGLGLLSIQERAKIINGIVSFEDKLNKSFKLTLKFNG